MRPDYVSFGNIFIDDIVLSDGRTFMATPGGAGTHALVGMRVWSESLGFVAFAGSDFPASFRQEMVRMGVDLEGVSLKDGVRTTRAWQIFEPDGRRIEVFRSDKGEFFRFAPDFADIPVAYHGARGYHLYWARAISELPRFVRQLRQVNPTATIVWEPAFHHGDVDANEMIAALSQVALFSPDEFSAYAMTGTNRADDAMAVLLDWGAVAVAIRMGAAGSLLGTSQGEWWRIPAAPAHKVDETGAGNAYCGGFVVGLAEGDTLLEAALRAAVSASFALEQFGIPDFDITLRAKAEKRLNWARDHVKCFRK